MSSFPAVSDLAREVRYRYFDQPVFERARIKVYEEAENHLDYLAAQSGRCRPPRPDPRADRVSAASGGTFRQAISLLPTVPCA